MKYWRGFLVAIILTSLTWGLVQFAADHANLVDMIYPYMTRLIQGFLSAWSADVTYCLWQLLLLVFGVILLAGLVLMIIMRLNPIQLIGWVCAGVSLFFLLHTGLYGLNHHAGSLAEDIHLEADYTLTHLVGATAYYRDKANALAEQVKRDGDGDVDFASFEDLSKQAGEGFRVLTYDKALSIFAGARDPVKKLSNADSYTAAGLTGMTMPLTGEACVNPDIPDICLPFAMCKEMAKRMIIVNDEDAKFAAYMACEANPSVEFQYSAYFMAFLGCYEAVQADTTSAAQAALPGLTAGINDRLAADLAAYNSFWDEHLQDSALDRQYRLEELYNSAMMLDREEALLEDEAEDAATVKQRYNYPELLTCLYIKEIVIPSKVEAENPFDPYDESQVMLK